MLSLYDELRRSEEDALARMDQAITESETFREERDEARAELQEWKDAAVSAEHPCPDEVHCTCVPLLLGKIAALRKERDEWKRLFDAVVTKVTERIKELNGILKT